MVNMKKILGILLALCFVVSVTAAAASAAPNDGRNGPNGPKNNDDKRISDNHDGKKNYDNHDGKKNYGNHYGQKKFYKKGYWGYKKVRHHPDRHHKFYWYTNDRCWFPGYWYWR